MVTFNGANTTNSKHSIPKSFKQRWNPWRSEDHWTDSWSPWCLGYPTASNGSKLQTFGKVTFLCWQQFPNNKLSKHHCSGVACQNLADWSTSHFQIVILDNLCAIQSLWHLPNKDSRLQCHQGSLHCRLQNTVTPEEDGLVANCNSSWHLQSPSWCICSKQ